MKTMFIIPSLISDTVPDKMVPLLCKLVERNIAVNYRNILQSAVKVYILKYSNESYEETEGEVLYEDRDILTVDKLIKQKKEDLDKSLRHLSDIDSKADPVGYNVAKTEVQLLKTEISDLISERKGIVSSYKSKKRKEEKDKKKREKERRKREKEEEKEKDKRELKKEKEEDKIRERKKLIKSPEKPISTGLDQTTVPSGVTFYKDINLEPTIVDISIGDYMFTIGFKCVPCRLKNPENLLLTIMQHGQGGLIKMIERAIRSNANWILRKLWGKAGYIARGRPVSGVVSMTGPLMGAQPSPGEEPINDIVFSPSVHELSNVKYLAKSLNSSSATAWSSLVIVTKEDVDNSGIDYDHFFKIYKRLTKIGWGDIMVVNTEKEEIYHCSLSLLSCTKIPMSYLQRLFNLDNILDFAELNKFSRGPFSKMPIRKLDKIFSSAMSK